MYRVTVVYDEPADKEAFDRRYADEHVPLVKAVPGLSGFQLSHPQGGTPYLVAELLFPSEDAYTVASATPEMAETRTHAQGCGTTFAVYAGDVADAGPPREEDIGVSTQVEDVVRRFYADIWNGRRYDVAGELFHPEFTYGGAPGVVGPEAKVGSLRSYHAAMPDLVVTVEELVTTEVTAAVRFVVEGTDTGGIRGRSASGQPVRAWGVDFFGMRDGLIASNWVGIDWLGLLVQTDVVPDPWG